MIRVVPATIEHCCDMGPRLREVSASECVAQGMSPTEAAIWSLQGSVRAETAVVDGVPEAMWGIAPVAAIGQRAVMWLLTTAAAMQHPLVIGRRAKYFADYCNRLYPIVECYVDDRHRAAVRMVEWLAFRPELRIPMRDTTFILYRRR